MALFKTDQCRSGYPQCVILQGSFQVPASPAQNLQILPSLLSLTNAGTAGAQVSATINPAGLKVNIFCSPLSGAAPAATNTARLPSGMPTGGVTPLGSEYLVDLTGFPADIVCVQMDLCRQARNNQTVFAQASYIDVVNKLLFIQVVGVTSGAATAAPSGTIISFQVAFKDTIGI